MISLKCVLYPSANTAAHYGAILQVSRPCCPWTRGTSTQGWISQFEHGASLLLMAKSKLSCHVSALRCCSGGAAGPLWGSRGCPTLLPESSGGSSEAPEGKRAGRKGSVVLGSKGERKRVRNSPEGRGGWGGGAPGMGQALPGGLWTD